MVQPLARSTATPRAQPPPRATTPLPLPQPTFRTPPPHIYTPGSHTTRGAPAPATRRGVTTTTRGGVNNARAATTTTSRMTDFDNLHFLLAEINVLQHKLAEDWTIQNDRHSAYLARVNTNKRLHTTECTQNVPPPSTATRGIHTPPTPRGGSMRIDAHPTTRMIRSTTHGMAQGRTDDSFGMILATRDTALVSGQPSLTTRVATGSDGTPTPCTTPTGGGGIVGTTAHRGITSLPAPASRGGRNDVPAVHTTSDSTAATTGKGSTDHLSTHTRSVCTNTTVRGAPTTTTREGSGIHALTTTACERSSFRAPPTIATRGESFRNIFQPTASGVTIPTTTTSKGSIFAPTAVDVTSPICHNAARDTNYRHAPPPAFASLELNTLLQRPNALYQEYSARWTPPDDRHGSYIRKGSVDVHAIRTSPTTRGTFFRTSTTRTNDFGYEAFYRGINTDLVN